MDVIPEELVRFNPRQELDRLKLRFLVAFLLQLFTLYYGRQAGFRSSDRKTKTGGGVAAFWWASEFERLALVCFLMVPVVVAVERLRRAREMCDVYLVLGTLFLLISLSFSAYLRWFVVVGSV